MPSLLPKFTSENNLFIIFSGSSHSKPFQTYSTNNVFSFDFLEKTTGLPFHDFDSSGKKIDNITDWALKLFQKNYADKTITKEFIFHYVYAVLHNPAYRKKYELNLKKRIPADTPIRKLLAMGNMGRAIDEPAHKL